MSFRARGNEYIKAANSVVDPVRKIALMDVAARWLRLAAQIDAVHIVAEEGYHASILGGALWLPVERSASVIEFAAKIGAAGRGDAAAGKLVRYSKSRSTRFGGRCAGNRPSGSRGRQISIRFTLSRHLTMMKDDAEDWRAEAQRYVEGVNEDVHYAQRTRGRTGLSSRVLRGARTQRNSRTTPMVSHTSGASFDRILRGAKPAELPVQAPTQFLLTINVQKTPKAIGIDVPPSILSRTDRVIE